MPTVGCSCLWTLRNVIHLNLTACFALHNVTWVVYAPVVRYTSDLDAHVCWLVAYLIRYFIAAGFFWMFVEGAYLFISVKYGLHEPRVRYSMCALVGWGEPRIL